MADISARIETLEHRLMRAWIQQDRRELKALVARDCIFHFAGKKRVILDRPSWLEAAGGRFACTSYQARDIYVRKYGSTAMVSAQFDLEMLVDNEAWAGPFWVFDVWRKSRVSRKWRLAERLLARPDERSPVPMKIRALQLWR